MFLRTSIHKGFASLSHKANSDADACSAFSNISCCAPILADIDFLLRSGELLWISLETSNALSALCALISGETVFDKKEISGISPLRRAVPNSLHSSSAEYRLANPKRLAAIWCSRIRHSYPSSVSQL